MMIVSALVVCAAMTATGMPTAVLGAVLALLLVYVFVNIHALMAAPALPSGTSMPVLLRHNTGVVDPKDPHKNVDYESLKASLDGESFRSASLKLQLQQKFNDDEYQSVKKKLTEMRLYPFN